MPFNHDDFYYCRYCGQWIKKESALLSFIRKRKGYKDKLITSNTPRCPTCHKIISTMPRARHLKEKRLERSIQNA